MEGETEEYREDVAWRGREGQTHRGREGGVC